jgi:hypothetical protein
MSDTVVPSVIEGTVVGVSPAYATVEISERSRPYTILPALKGKHDHVSPGDRVRVDDPVNGEARVVEVMIEEAPRRT